MDPQIVFLDWMDEDQEHLTPVASASGPMIGGTSYSDKPTGECLLIPAIESSVHAYIYQSVWGTGDNKGGVTEQAEASRGTCRYHYEVGCISLCASRQESP